MKISKLVFVVLKKGRKFQLSKMKYDLKKLHHGRGGVKKTGLTGKSGKPSHILMIFVIKLTSDLP